MYERKLNISYLTQSNDFSAKLTIAHLSLEDTSSWNKSQTFYTDDPPAKYYILLLYVFFKQGTSESLANNKEYICFKRFG